ncbi:hypothetical protein QAD60_00695 [Helicobacter pylori]|nr:hypothetical protein [Helicobacter pylori]
MKHLWKTFNNQIDAISPKHEEVPMEKTPTENHEVTPPPPIPHKMRNKTLLLKRNKTLKELF